MKIFHFFTFIFLISKNTFFLQLTSQDVAKMLCSMSTYSPTTITSSGGKTRDATDEERGEGNDDAELAPVLHATMSGALGHSKAKGAGQLKNQSSGEYLSEGACIA